MRMSPVHNYYNYITLITVLLHNYTYTLTSNELLLFPLDYNVIGEVLTGKNFGATACCFTTFGNLYSIVYDR